MSQNSAALPRLLYIGDVPVEASYQGSALLYRLLQNYPADRLCIAENIKCSQPGRRLPSVEYAFHRVVGTRLLTTRLHRWASSAFSLLAGRVPRRLANLVQDFGPEVILTVAHGYSWMTAAAVAKQWRLPLHLIVHDDWPAMVGDTPRVRRIVQLRFAESYRFATSRLCVSPYMAAAYEQQYGVAGLTLYPGRSANCLSQGAPPPRDTNQQGTLVFAFAGTINSAGLVKALGILAQNLLKQSARLRLYGPFRSSDLAQRGLDLPNIEFRDLVPSHEIVARLRADADVVLLPMSFTEADRSNMTLAFPSKLTDYTASGLPILIYGPEYCSALRWAKSYPGVAEVATDETELLEALGRLQSASHRQRLGQRAQEVGDELFSHAMVERQFFSALQAAGSTAGDASAD